MSRLTLKAVALIAFMAAPVLAFGQGAVQQSGIAAPGHLACWAQNGSVYDCGPPFGAQVGTPASSSARCTKGQIEFYAAYLYACVATNAWRRIAMSSF
jgi:hypothetical protein